MRELFRRALILTFLLLTLHGIAGRKPRIYEYVLERPPALPVCSITEGAVSVNGPLDATVARVASFSDELTAYLHFEYVRSLKMVDEDRVLLTAAETPGGPVYHISIEADRDLLRSVPYLADLKARNYISGFRIHPASTDTLKRLRQQTSVFLAAYNFPVRRKLESLDAAQLLSPTVRFILLKSKTDRRIRNRLEPRPETLSNEQASQIAADVIEVARFYSLPLDFFLGIGAMENNYMAINGDLDHAVWKRRAEPGDIVVRRRGRVLVKNFSLGAWQITRETLRYAHDLYLKDERDYSGLPPRLVPPLDLDLEATDRASLTTYAGLLFRDLLDRFDGDVTRAVGAYNGGVARPNAEYAEGVATAARHARSVVERVAALNGRAVLETPFIAPARPRSEPPAAPPPPRPNRFERIAGAIRPAIDSVVTVIASSFTSSNREERNGVTEQEESDDRGDRGAGGRVSPGVHPAVPEGEETPG